LHEFAPDPHLHIDLVTSALGNKQESIRHSERIRIFKVPVWNKNIHHSSNRELLFYAWQAFYLARKLHRQNRYDLCFAWSAVPAGAIAYSLQRLCGLPYMVWASGPDIPGFEHRYRTLYPFLLPLLRRVWRAANPMIVKCQGEADMIHRFEPGLNLEIIPNGVDVSKFITHDKPEQDGPLRIICVARLIERKGQHHLIQAAKILRDQGIEVQVTLVGTGDSLSAFRDLARKLNIKDWVEFAGYIPREDLPARFAAADVFVLPSYNEGMSLAALEALSSGLPLILTMTGGTEWLVQDNCNGFTYDWGDVAALVECLRKLATDHQLRLEMSRASRQIALQYSWNKISSKYLNLFEACALGNFQVKPTH
jgi:phosphatidyl-myo-inositol dimannoside synthase